MDLEKIFSSRTQTRILQHFLENPSRVYNQAGLARFLDCSPSTVARLLDPFIKEGIVMFEQIGGQMKVIALNVESEKVQALLEFYRRIRNL